MEITKNRLLEDELENVSGGMQTEVNGRASIDRAGNDAGSDKRQCPVCGDNTAYTMLSGGGAKCGRCGSGVYDLQGIASLHNYSNSKEA